ncbi:hypothetical protein [Novosphingobium sp. FSW06-99]|uniref:hypothetical protein n=1 Tax=Novosphingobium sp. FSW06-99 TaxID=1739113 RepID=UPI000AE4A31A|nr:hypothetical protein [Novosphingobium sp. FSW06-99]
MADPTTYSDLHRDLGRVEGGLEAMEKRFDRVEETLERIDDRLARIEASENERKGAWWAIVTIAAVIGAFAGTLISHFWK